MSEPTRWGMHQLKRDLATMQDPDERLSNGFNAAEERLLAALDELATLRAKVREMVQLQMLWQARSDEASRMLIAEQQWRTQAEPLLRALADESPYMIFEGSLSSTRNQCRRCHRKWVQGSEQTHAAYCPVALAKAILGEGGQ